MTAPPLAGRRVVVTRGAAAGDSLDAALEEAGAEVLRVPLIEVEVLARPEQLAGALARLRAATPRAGAGRWLVLTSQTSVDLAGAAAGAGGLAGLAIAVVGPATAAAVRSRGLDVAVVAPGQEAASLASELASRCDGAAVLVVTAAGGRDVIAPALAAAGAQVEAIEAYRSVMPGDAPARLREAFARPVDAIVFTSGSTVRHCASVLAEPPPSCIAACIGPFTAAAARAAGWRVVVTAAEHSAIGLAAVVVEHLSTAHPLP